MYIAIRSAKHNGSTSFTHGRDIDHLLELQSFADVARYDGIVQPIFMAFVDGGPDENPRFPKTLAQLLSIASGNIILTFILL